MSQGLGRTRAAERPWERGWVRDCLAFSYPEPFLRAVNGARQGALAKSISNWHLIGYNEGYCSNNVYILLPCFYGIRFWIWPEPLVAPRVRRALGTRMDCWQLNLVPRACDPWEGNEGSGIIYLRHTENCMSTELRMRCQSKTNCLKYFIVSSIK